MKPLELAYSAYGKPKDMRAFNHELIQGEFREAFSGERDVHVDTDEVVVLSAYEFIPDNDGVVRDFSIPQNEENRQRIKVGMDVVQEATALKMKEEDATAPLLVLNGTTTQLPFMEQIAEELVKDAQFEFPFKIVSVDCGPMGKANTKTQFEALYEENAKIGFQPRRVVAISSAYHVPRVKRTGNANIGAVELDVFAANQNLDPGVVKSEVGKIATYAAKGDITWAGTRPGDIRAMTPFQLPKIDR